MKTSIVITLAALLLGASAGLAQASSLLIGKELLNGGFEAPELKPWFGQSDAPGPQIENDPALVKEGKQSVRIQLAGHADRRVTARLFQNVNKVDAAMGKHFVVKAEVSAVKGRPLPVIVGEIVLFDGNAVLGTLPLRGDQPDGKNWQTMELSVGGEVPADWQGGMIQLRLIFLVDGGVDGTTYELLLDNVELVQSRQ